MNKIKLGEPVKIDPRSTLSYLPKPEPEELDTDIPLFEPQPLEEILKGKKKKEFDERLFLESHPDCELKQCKDLNTSTKVFYTNPKPRIENSIALCSHCYSLLTYMNDTGQHKALRNITTSILEKRQ